MYSRRLTNGITLICFTLSAIFFQPGAARSEVPTAEMPGIVEIKEKAPHTVKLLNENAPEQQNTAVTLEQEIKIAKGAFTVPESFDQFTSGFEQSGNRSFWELRWYRTGEQEGELYIRVNAANGEIWSMRQWLPPIPGQGYRGLPKYTRTQAEAVASALARQLQPQRFKDTMLQPGKDYFYAPLHQERGQVEYYYHYARLIQGVPFKENGINITVSGDTGEVLNFDINWEDTTGFPPAVGMITPERAEQIFRAESSPALNYFRPSVPGGKEVPLKLVYRLPGEQDQVLIDAVSGKVLSGEGKFHYFSDGYGGAGGGPRMEKLAMDQITLRPMEEVAVAEAKNFLTSEKALQAVKTHLGIPDGYSLNGSRLEQDYLFKELKTWHFNWQSGEEPERKWMDVSVDSSSGELISFNFEGRLKYGYTKAPDVQYSEEAARQIAADYIKKLQPAKWGELSLRSSRPELALVLDAKQEPLPRSYNFFWSRVAKGIPFPDNSFTVTVNSTTGEVTSYRMTWWPVQFPEVKGVISPEAAADKYLKEAPLSAAYVRLWPDYQLKDPQVYLVYHMPQKNFFMLDARSGKTLDFRGDPVSAPKEAGFDDMQGHPAREAVEMLANIGIVSGTEGKFRPDDVITQAELITMLVKSTGGYSLPSPKSKDSWYQPYYEAAARLGIIQPGEKPDPDATVSREVLARLIINTIGYSKVAQLEDIYVLHFEDAGSITKSYRGHAALATGLGLIEPVKSGFHPTGLVTRADAALTLVKLPNSK